MPWMTLQAGEVLVEIAYPNHYRYQIIGPGRLVNEYRYDTWTGGAWLAPKTPPSGLFNAAGYRYATAMERPALDSPLLVQALSAVAAALLPALWNTPTGSAVPSAPVVLPPMPFNRQAPIVPGPTPGRASVSNGAALLQFFGAEAAKKPAGMPNTCGRCEDAMSATLDAYYGSTKLVSVRSKIEGTLTLHPGLLCSRCRPRGC